VIASTMASIMALNSVSEAMTPVPNLSYVR